MHNHLQWMELSQDDNNDVHSFYLPNESDRRYGTIRKMPQT